MFTRARRDITVAGELHIRTLGKGEKALLESCCSKSFELGEFEGLEPARRASAAKMYLRYTRLFVVEEKGRPLCFFELSNCPMLKIERKDYPRRIHEFGFHALVDIEVWEQYLSLFIRHLGERYRRKTLYIYEVGEANPKDRKALRARGFEKIDKALIPDFVMERIDRYAKKCGAENLYRRNEIYALVI
jgi:hypothetical protein